MVKMTATAYGDQTIRKDETMTKTILVTRSSFRSRLTSGFLLTPFPVPAPVADFGEPLVLIPLFILIN